jgi:hypothetical protein
MDSELKRPGNWGQLKLKTICGITNLADSLPSLLKDLLLVNLLLDNLFL